MQHVGMTSRFPTSAPSICVGAGHANIVEQNFAPESPQPSILTKRHGLRMTKSGSLDILAWDGCLRPTQVVNNSDDYKRVLI